MPRKPWGLMRLPEVNARVFAVLGFLKLGAENEICLDHGFEHVSILPQLSTWYLLLRHLRAKVGEVCAEVTVDQIGLRNLL